jgi:hypothetical protein
MKILQMFRFNKEPKEIERRLQFSRLGKLLFICLILISKTSTWTEKMR